MPADIAGVCGLAPFLYGFAPLQLEVQLALPARAPPELETDWVGTAAFAFDQSLSWDPTAPPHDPGYSFDQTLN